MAKNQGDIIHPVILCGGSGTRLWPVSRKERPKPFIALLGERTLFEEALERVSDAAQFTSPQVVAGNAHKHAIEASKGAKDARLIIEPAARNTAPAIALAAARLDCDAVMLVCPADHHIGDTDAFCRAAKDAAALARQGWLVSFAIKPDRPETGYGYIRRGAPEGTGFVVDSFVEKPDLQTARKFLADPAYAWNGGIFAFRAGTYLDELARHRPEMAEHIAEAIAAGREEGNCFYPDADAFARIAGESVDYALMENTARAALVPADMEWSDIGNWAALADALGEEGECDRNGNHAGANGELVDCENVLAMSDGPRISAVGLSDISIIVDGDEVLVTSREGAQKVGKLRGASEQ